MRQPAVHTTTYTYIYRCQSIGTGGDRTGQERIGYIVVKPATGIIYVGVSQRTSPACLPACLDVCLII